MKVKRRRSKVIALLLAVLFVLAGTMTALAEVSEPAGTSSEQVVEAEVSDTNLNGTFLPVCPYPWPVCPYPWPPCPVWVTVNFDMHGHGDDVEPQAWWSWVYVTEPETPSAEGWEFGGWYADAEYNEDFEFNRWLCKDTTVHAKWSEMTATLSYDANGKEATAPDASTMWYSEAANAAGAITATGYNFTGWNTKADGSGTAYAAGDEVKAANEVPEDICLYAQWVKDEPTPVTKYTVSFEMNGHGEQVASQEVEHGKTASEPAKPSAEGYTFDGWFANKELTESFDFATPITAKTTIYAKWSKNEEPTTPTPTDPTVPTHPVNPTYSPTPSPTVPAGPYTQLSVVETSPVETAAETQLDTVPETGRNVPVILGTMAMLSALLYAGTRKVEDGLRRKKRKH